MQDPLDHLLRGHGRPGHELAMLFLSGGQNFDMRATDVDHQHVHPQFSLSKNCHDINKETVGVEDWSPSRLGSERLDLGGLYRLQRRQGRGLTAWRAAARPACA